MGEFQSVSVAADRVMKTLIAGLELEFGRGAGAALAHRFLEAEELDFLWDARLQERWLGAYESLDSDAVWLDRVRILGRLDGHWYVATMIVDGDGNPQGLLGKREFAQAAEARKAFAHA